MINIRYSKRKLLKPIRQLTFQKSIAGHAPRIHTNNAFFQISEEVQHAIRSNKPVVALETTIYTHGFPYPENAELASHLESVVREHGGLPATIGVLDGVARVGMTADEITRLVVMEGRKNETLKLSRRDIGYICGLIVDVTPILQGLSGRKLNGGTTVAATMLLAHLAGIRVFATGGLGGVHRGGELSLDISADLRELGRTPVAVISSGCKSFLDIPRTLEYLETEGVGVATFADGREGEVDFPAFWTRESGVRSPSVVRDEVEAASIIYAQSILSISSGLLFANPIPSRAALDKADIDKAIKQATDEASYSGIQGNANTPFILKRIKELTQGASTTANRLLVENNVIRGTKVAMELSKLYQDKGHQIEGLAFDQICPGQKLPALEGLPEASSARLYSALTTGGELATKDDTTRIPIDWRDPVEIAVAGAVAIDSSCDFTPLKGNMTRSTIAPQLHTSNPATIIQSLGGVGHNIAYAAHLLGSAVRLCSVVADDVSGKIVLDMLDKEGLHSDNISVVEPAAGRRTAQYVAFNDGNKDLVMAMADMSLLENPNGRLNPQWRFTIREGQPKWLVVDANWDPTTLGCWTCLGKDAGSNVVVEPVSAAKAARLFYKRTHGTPRLGVFPHHQIDVVTPNEIELAAMYEAARANEHLDRPEWWHVINSFGLPSGNTNNRLVAITSRSLVELGIPQRSLQLLPFMPCIITKLGRQGVLLTQILRHDDRRLGLPASAPYILSRITQEDSKAAGVYMRLFPPAEMVPDTDVVSVNGAGDTFLGALVAGLARSNGLSLDRLIEIAQKGSVMTLKSESSVHPSLGQLNSELGGN